MYGIANVVFCKLDKMQLENINRKYDVKYWDERINLVRIATTFETEKSVINELVSLL